MSSVDKAGLILALETDIVTFTFTKVSHSSRIAEGTRNLDLIPKNHHPKGTGVSKGNDILTFFDWQKQAWRSCKISSIFGPWKIQEQHRALRDIAEKAKLI
jgi:hypothetical protein